MQHGSMQGTRHPKTPTLGFRMLAVFSFVILTAAGGITLVVNRTLHETTLSERGEQLVGDAESLVRLMSADIGQQLLNVTARSANMVPLGFDTNLRALQRALDSWQQFMPGYSWIGYANSEGIVVAATGGLLVGQSVATRPWFQAGREGPTVIDCTRLFCSLNCCQKRTSL